MSIIHTINFYCELCDKEIACHVHGSADTIIDKKEEPDVIEWARHYHWIDLHRVCAVCGELIKPGELEVYDNDGTIAIHPDYTDEYEKIRRGHKDGPLLIVHTQCIPE